MSAKPITAEFRRQYQLTIPVATAAYVVAAGRVGKQAWFIVGYQDRQGHPCLSQRGFFARSDAYCQTSFDTEEPVYLLGGSGPDNRAFLEWGIAAPQVRTVVFLTDTGRSWSTPTVRAGSSHFRFWAARDPRGGRGGIPEEAWKGSDDVLHRVADTSAVLPKLCPKSESPLQGIPDGLPRAGSTKFASATAIADRSGGALVASYGATDIRVEPRNGQVWLPAATSPKVVEAADALLRLYLPSASKCPRTIQSYGGVPLSFAIGPAPALVPNNKVQTVRTPLTRTTESPPDRKS